MFSIRMIFACVNCFFILISQTVAQGQEPNKVPVKVVDSEPIPKNALAALSKKFGGEIVAASKKIISVDGSIVQVTGVECATPKDRGIVVGKYWQEVGRSISVLPGKKNTVFEVRALDPDARQAVLSYLPIDAVQAQKIQPGEYPRHWVIVNEITVDSAHRKRINEQLEIETTGLVNQIFRVGVSNKLQVNTMTAESDAKAVAVQSKLKKAVGDVNEVILVGRTVYEIISDDEKAKQFAAAVVRRSPTAKYRIRFQVSPVATGDDMTFTPIFNSFLKYRLGAPDEKAAAEIELEDYRGGLTFADYLQLQASSRASYTVDYEFEPAAKARKGGGTDMVIASFGDLPKVVDYPTVDVVATYETQDRFPRSKFEAEEIDALTKGRLTMATEHWPSDDPKIKRAVGKVISDDQSDLEKVTALHATVYKNIKFDGESKGSRYGVMKVLEQRFGHCWDKSDVYVTMARSAGIPTRQVGGWVLGLTGHAWSESYVDGMGWIPVDTTWDQIGTSRHYLPLFSTDDGAMKILYTDMPVIERID